MTSNTLQANPMMTSTTPFVGDQNLLKVREFIEEGSDRGPDPIKFVIRTLRGRLRFLMLVSLITVGLFGLAGFAIKSPVYQSEGLIRVAANKPSILYGGQNSTSSKHYDAFVEAEVTYLSNRPVRERAIALRSRENLYEVPPMLQTAAPSMARNWPAKTEYKGT